MSERRIELGAFNHHCLKFNIVVLNLNIGSFHWNVCHIGPKLWSIHILDIQYFVENEKPTTSLTFFLKFFHAYFWRIYMCWIIHWIWISETQQSIWYNFTHEIWLLHRLSLTNFCLVVDLSKLLEQKQCWNFFIFWNFRHFRHFRQCCTVILEAYYEMNYLTDGINDLKSCFLFQHANIFCTRT